MYLGEEINDIRSITRLKLKSPIMIFNNEYNDISTDLNLNFVRHAMLFYSVFVLNEKIELKGVE